MNTAFLFLIGLAGCSWTTVYYTVGDCPEGDPTPPSGDGDSAGSEDTGDGDFDSDREDSGDSGEESTHPKWILEAATPSGAATTCSQLGEVDWTLRREWIHPIPDFCMNVVVAPREGDDHATIFVDAGETVELVDGRTGTTEDLLVLGYLGDDGSTAAVGNADRVPGLELLLPRWTFMEVLDVATMTTYTFPTGTGDDELVFLADVDQDAIHEVILMRSIFEIDGMWSHDFPGGLEPTGLFATDLDGDGFPEIAHSEGVYYPTTTTEVPWSDPVGGGYSFYGGPVEHAGEVGVLFVEGRDGMFLGRRDGSIAWSTPDGGERFLTSIGDASGDGVPDACLTFDDNLILLDAGGRVRRTWALGPFTTKTGGCTLADLDADDIYEVLLLGWDGFWILDGTTGDVLAWDPSLHTNARDSGPVVADVDGDGSAEILLLSRPDYDSWMTELVALGPATGRWARTRLVWNQLAYDITGIEDDGDLVSRPVPVWEAYGAFRAQPSHDGAHPDLSIELLGQTSIGGETVLEFVARNQGSEDAATGAVVRLDAFDGSAWGTVTSKALDEGIAAGFAVEGSLTLDSELLGRLFQLIVVPSHADDCDHVNDRTEAVMK